MECQLWLQWVWLDSVCPSYWHLSVTSTREERRYSQNSLDYPQVFDRWGKYHPLYFSCLQNFRKLWFFDTSQAKIWLSVLKLGKYQFQKDKMFLNPTVSNRNLNQISNLWKCLMFADIRRLCKKKKKCWYFLLF